MKGKFCFFHEEVHPRIKKIFLYDWPRIEKEKRKQPYGELYAKDRILVKFKPTVSSQIISHFVYILDAEIEKTIPALGIHKIKLPQNISIEEVLYTIRRNPDVDYAEPDYKMFICVLPNDTYFDYQYALQNKGQPIGPAGSISGQTEADMGALGGWEETVGDETIVVAVIDTGIDWQHPDLQKNVMLGGWNFIEDNDDVTDDHGHGTFMTGLIAADTNNGLGISGIAWQCKVLPIKGIDADGEGYTSEMIQAIIWAAEQRVDIINLSVGAEWPSQALESAINYANDNNILCVSSAGNHRGPVSYPAAYENCMAVSGTDFEDKFLQMSNFGPEIDVAAPAARIFGCIPTWTNPEESYPYDFWTGTSSAAAHVSGLAALIKSIKPWLTPKEIKNIIRYSAVDINKTIYPGKDDYLGYGRINIERALVPIKIK